MFEKIKKFIDRLLTPKIVITKNETTNEIVTTQEAPPEKSYDTIYQEMYLKELAKDPKKEPAPEFFTDEDRNKKYSEPIWNVADNKIDMNTALLQKIESNLAETMIMGYATSYILNEYKTIFASLTKIIESPLKSPQTKKRLIDIGNRLYIDYIQKISNSKIETKPTLPRKKNLKKTKQNDKVNKKAKIRR